MKPYQMVIDIIRDLARKEPDRTSRDSYFAYDEDITPECIFGHALAIFGARLVKDDGFVVRSPEGLDLVKGYQSASLINWENIGIELPAPAEVRWSDYVQGRQDNGLTWGEAVRLADEASIL